MSSIISYIMVAVTSLAISPFVVAFTNKFIEEEKNINSGSAFKFNFRENISFDNKISLILPFLWIALFYVLGPGLDFALFAFLSILLVISFFVDIKAQIIPNETNFVGFIVGIIVAYIKLTQNYDAGLDALFGMFTGAGIFLAIAFLALIIYRKVGMGMGDVKLMGMLGLFFGFANTIQVFVLSFLIGAIISLFLLATKRKKTSDYIPFGPFIVLASVITMFIPATTTVNYLLSVL